MSDKHGDEYYALTRFRLAVRHLATSDGPWPERLRETWQYVWTRLTEADFPPEDASRALIDFRALRTRITFANPAGLTADATLALISEAEARAIAGLFVDVAYDLADAIINEPEQTLFAQLASKTDSNDDEPEDLSFLTRAQMDVMGALLSTAKAKETDPELRERLTKALAELGTPEEAS